MDRTAVPAVPGSSMDRTAVPAVPATLTAAHESRRGAVARMRLGEQWHALVYI